MGARPLDEERLPELLEIIDKEIFADLPDLKHYTSQGNLFSGFGGDRVIKIHLQSRDRAAAARAAELAQKLLLEALPDVGIVANPSLEQAEPELRLTPDDRRISEAGWSRSDVGVLVRALGRGQYVGEHFDGERRMDIILRAKPWDSPEKLASMPVATASGSLVPLSELVDIQRTVGPDQLVRIDSRRTITLDVYPPDDVSLEHLLQVIESDVEPRVREIMPKDGNILYGGSADGLTRAIRSMAGNFALALVVLFVLMAALFRSPLDSAMVVLALPLATVGGVAALRLLNLLSFQPLDLLTMIGFIILLGLVANNAILLVDQTRSAERDGMGRREAVEESLRTRLRPIFMTTLTSIFGMLPLVLLPGEGSVIYRGLAAVIVGGMCVSTIFSLLLLPCLLRMGEGSGGLVAGTKGRQPDPLQSAA
jgi:multidrug efflux pump subunit AcrB